MDFSKTIDKAAERKLLKRGTKNALDKLALAFMSEAVIYCRHCSRGGLSETELVSMCWIALRQAAKNYRLRKSNGIGFFGFAKQYLRGQICKEFKRLEVVRRGGELVEMEEEIPALVPTSCDPDFRGLEAKELSRGMQPAILRTLNEMEREIIRLRYEFDLSFREIGERLGYRRQHIQTLHKESLLKLRGALESSRSQLL